MKLTGSAIDRFLRAPDPAIQAVLVFGPNYGLIRDHAQTLLDRNGGEVSELRGMQIQDDPAALHDAAYASSLFGGGAPIFVREASDKITATLESVLEGSDAARNFIVVEAGELTPKSKLRALFENTPHLAAIACYAETGEQLAQKLKDMAAEQGCTIAPEALDYMIERLPGDRAAQRQEMDKLALYTGSGNMITLKEAMACIGDAADVDVFDLPWQVFNGDGLVVDKTLGRLIEESTADILILRTLLGHAVKLHQAQSAIRNGQSQSQAMQGVRPPIFRNMESKFQNHLRRWPLPALTRAIGALNEAERQCKSTGYPGTAIVRQLATQLTQKVL